MRNPYVSAVVVVALLGCPLIALGQNEMNVTIKVAAPNVINVATQSSWVTVHADIPYWMVDHKVSIKLNGVEIAWSKVDAQGDFVAKFAAAKVKDLVAINPGDPPVKLTLTLSGGTIYGIPFTGSAEVTVINAKGK